MKQISSEDGIRLFGKFSFGILLEKLPVDINVFHNDPKRLLLGLNDVIHMEVKKLYEDADLPYFEFVEPKENVLIMKYYSTRKLYPFVKGLLDGLALYMNTPFSHEFEKGREGLSEYGIYTISFEKE